MDDAVKRPWYRLHWVTSVITILVTGALIHCESEKKGISIVMSGSYISASYFGWPRAHLKLAESGGLVGRGTMLPTSYEYDWRWSDLGLNVLVCALILGSTTWFAESWIRSSNRLQFKLRALLLFTGVVGVLLWLTVNRDWLFWSRWPHSPLLGWADLQRPLRWPVLLGITCTVYSLGWVALAILRRAYRVFRP